MGKGAGELTLCTPAVAAVRNLSESLGSSATGQKLESYGCSISVNGELGCQLEGTNTYLAGKMISEKGVVVATDRLGSVRADSTATNFAYFPWGEERGQTAHTGRTLFAGYYRDAVGQDYAMARYYNATTGAFWSQDPGSISTADSSSPTSWNRYGFVTGDPVRPPKFAYLRRVTPLSSCSRYSRLNAGLTESSLFSPALGPAAQAEPVPAWMRRRVWRKRTRLGEGKPPRRCVTGNRRWRIPAFVAAVN